MYGIASGRKTEAFSKCDPASRSAFSKPGTGVWKRNCDTLGTIDEAKILRSAIFEGVGEDDPLRRVEGEPRAVPEAVRVDRVDLQLVEQLEQAAVVLALGPVGVQLCGVEERRREQSRHGLQGEDHKLERRSPRVASVPGGRRSGAREKR